MSGLNLQTSCCTSVTSQTYQDFVVALQVIVMLFLLHTCLQHVVSGTLVTSGAV